jgi:hypothetical protein
MIISAAVCCVKKVSGAIKNSFTQIGAVGLLPHLPDHCLHPVAFYIITIIFTAFYSLH